MFSMLLGVRYVRLVSCSLCLLMYISHFAPIFPYITKIQMSPEVAALVMDPAEAAVADGGAGSSSPLAAAQNNDTYTPDSLYDLFSLGCILYSLVFGSEMWNINKNGDISSADLVQLARWSPISFLDKASITFPIEGRTDNQKAAIDLISKLLAPTPHDRRAAFEFGMVSVRLSLIHI